jgi:hypothetical protein
VYYVKVATRSSRASVRQSPRRAVAYITDNHDVNRDPGCSHDELRYIARMGEGWKTELEGGRLPLIGFGTLEGIVDREELVSRFEGTCQPWHDKRGTTGYKSFTFTVPKELSLHAEGHAREVKEAMYAAIREALGRGFPDKDFGAVAAIHTRNEAGEIHFHAHVLVGKFARCRLTRRLVSLNSQAGGNNGRRVDEIKRGWKEAIDRELAARLQLRVEQPARFARPALVLPDGTRVAPLNRDGRRLLDKQLSPTYEETTKTGQVARKVLRLSEAMDGRIMEVASGFGGEGWSAQGFLDLAPDQARWLARYEKRVEILKRVGYLTADGKVTPAFRRHMCARLGVDSPELQRLRLDVSRYARRRGAQTGQQMPPPSLWEAIHLYENARRRVERLGVTRQDLRRIEDEAAAQRLRPENLRRVRKEFEREALVSPPKLVLLPRTKGVVRAYVDLQKARVEACRLIVAGVLRLQYSKHKRRADAVRAKARRDLFYARERRLAQLGRMVRALFWATRLVLPRQTRRLELAIARCAALVKTNEVQRAWRREFIAKRKTRLLQQAARLERPAQLPLRPQVDQAQAAIPLPGEHDVDRLRAGIAALRYREPRVAALLFPWESRLPELVRRVAAFAKGDPGQLARPVYEAALRAAQVVKQVPPEKPSPALPTLLTSPMPANTQSPAVQGAGPQVDALAAGLDLMRRHAPDRAALLEPWSAKLSDLNDRVLASTKGRTDQLPPTVLEVALNALRAGRLLEREKAARQVTIPAPLAQHEKELQRVQARLYAAKHGHLLSREVLCSLPPVRVADILREVRQAGLSDQGPAWALRQRELGVVIKSLAATIQKEVDLDR